MMRRNREVLRWLFVAGLTLGVVNSSAEATDVLSGWGDAGSIIFTVLIHAAAIILLVLREPIGKWVALAVFLSDAMLATFVAIDLPEASSNSHLVAAGLGAAAAATFAVATYCWSGDE